jgi:hypothetical protein
MKKLVFIFLSVLYLFAQNSYVLNLIGEKEYKNYAPLLKNFDEKLSLRDSVRKLEDLGLINLFFNKPKIVNTEFIFEDNNPILEAKILYRVLNLMGYYYFYPSKISFDGSKYVIDIEMKSNHYINPLIFIDTIENFNTKVKNIIKRDKYYYFIDASNLELPAIKLSENSKRYINAKGEYWINIGNFKKIKITSSKFDNWYPYVVFYDKNLNILNIIAYKKIFRSLVLNIPDDTKYIKIRDNFSKINFKRGILIKGLK